MDVCVIGLGNMGSAVAERLVTSGFAVRGHDPSAAAARQAEAAGIEIAATASEAAAGAEAVITSLPNDGIVRAVWTGEDGLLECATPGAALIELSTVGSQVLFDIAADPRAARFRLVDAPISGSPTRARAGDLTVMVGGSQDDVAVASPVLEALGTVLFVGEFGQAKVVKIVNNLMALGNLMVAAEAFSLGTASGIDPTLLHGVLSQTGGRSHHFVQRFPNAIAGDFSPGFSIDLGEKDMRLALQLANDLGLPAPAASLTQSLYAVARNRGYGTDDIVAILKVYEEWGRPSTPPQ